MRTSSAIIGFVLVALLGCASHPQPVIQQPGVVKANESKMEIKVTSTAFQEGHPIPRTYTCDGVNVSPPLEWSGVP
ncbi:MAG: YbhB/YbcL family Raf kinase inhibitor-like protein, partial [Acidobacteriota bacterium]